MAITEITRRDLFDVIEKSKICGIIYGIEFLSRLYDLKKLRANVKGYDNTYEELLKFEEQMQCHERNEALELMEYEYESFLATHWSIFKDPRFGLSDGDDETLLRFLCETIHPMVCSDAQEVDRLLKDYNEILKHDGFQIVEKNRISGRPVFSGRKIDMLGIPNLSATKKFLGTDSSYIAQKITQMEATVNDNPEAAIGTAKELVETCCKDILNKRGKCVPKKSNLPNLVKDLCKILSLTPDDIDDKTQAADTIKRLLMNLTTITQGIAELRNAYGAGHGRPSSTKGLTSRHAKLAVGAATTLAIFLVETHSMHPIPAPEAEGGNNGHKFKDSSN